jgi:hypothetical protein
MYKQAAFILVATLVAGTAAAQSDEPWPALDPQAPQATMSRVEVRGLARAQHAAGVVREPGEAFDGEETADAPSTALRYQVVGDARKARSAGTWPVHDYDGAGVTVPRSRPAAKPRKEYPNVMGVDFKVWLASHP